MTKIEMIENIKAENKNTEEYKYLGVRFEKLDRKVGDYCGNSKGNPDRLDSRDFPEYGNDEYSQLPNLEGTSVYDADYWDKYIDLEDCIAEELHVYVIGSNDYDEGEDYDEMIMTDAVVVGVIL